MSSLTGPTLHKFSLTSSFSMHSSIVLNESVRFGSASLMTFSTPMHSTR